jgi:excisionase family DNA binding protein
MRFAKNDNSGNGSQGEGEASLAGNNSLCEPLIDAAAAAKIIGVCAKTVKRLAIRKTIPAVRLGKYWRFRASALDEWIRNEMGVQSFNSPCPPQRREIN